MMCNDGNKMAGIIKHPFLRILLLASGWILVGLAVLGIVVPLLPTTPFLLLAGSCFYKSSHRFYSWLHTNRIFGKYLADYRDKRGIPARVKTGTLLFLWVSLIVSFFLVPVLWVRILLGVIGVVVTLHILLIRPRR